EPYVTARREIGAPLAALQRMIASDPEASRYAGRIQTLAATVLQLFEDLRQQGAAGGRATAALDQLERGREQMDELRSEIAGMQEYEQRLLQTRTEAAESARGRLQSAVFAGGAVGLLGGVIAAFLFTAGIARRARRLEQQADLLARGIPFEGGEGAQDEIGRLERALKDATMLLTRQGDDLRASQEQLEARVARRTEELESANQELHLANQVRQAVIQSSPLAIWASDPDGIVTFWNPAAERIFGWTEMEVIGKPLPVIPDDQQAEFREWLERYRRGETLQAVERKRKRKDGTLIDVSIYTAPLRDASGNITGTIAIDSDITQQNLLEEQFRQSQKLEAVGRLAGGVAHDFNNLLTVIIGYVEMLMADAKDSADLMDYAQEIKQAATRASALTAQLLAFSRRQISQPRILDLNEVVTHSTKLLRRVIGEDIEIITRLDPQLSHVKLDPIHIDQLLMNLVVNARDAMSGGGKLIIETANTTLDENYLGRHIGVKPGPYVMLAVSDTGAGMTQETKSRLFEPFFTTKEAGKGTGLGLSIVYGIVKQNGGDINVYSELGKGTSFKIYLPMAGAAAEAWKSEAPLGDLRGSETILLCEDETVIRRLVQSMLAKQGYTVLEAETPEKALEMARQPQAIDLLLTDLVMPKMSGFELAHAVREIRPEIKLLYMSGYTDQRITGTWTMAPDTPFLQKPFTAALLAQRLRETLDAKTSKTPERQA
ncbi:MAG TPA: PAS domain S-box protein, partial [Bryobacteraceae bacterium]